MRALRIRNRETRGGSCLANQEVENCHRQLIERLNKPERKLVLGIIDTQNLIAEEYSIDSFICGFRLVWKMVNERNHHEENRHPLSAEEAETDACFCYRIKFPGAGEILRNQSNDRILKLLLMKYQPPLYLLRRLKM